jgi:hypothetical protein
VKDGFGAAGPFLLNCRHLGLPERVAPFPAIPVPNEVDVDVLVRGPMVLKIVEELGSLPRLFADKLRV